MKTIHIPLRQRGMALVASLLLLVVITILGLTMFRSYGLTERVAGNTREKERALAAALGTQSFAEYYLNGQSGSASMQTTDCSGIGQAAAVTTTMVCTNPVVPSTGSVAQVPWTNSFTFTPPGINAGSAYIGTAGGFYQAPQFFISYLGELPKVGIFTTTVFQVDAVAWGGSPQTVAVVESGYQVVTYKSPTNPKSGGPTAGMVNTPLGGP